MVLQFEQKFRWEEQSFSSGVPRSLMAEYFLVMTLVYVNNSMICVSFHSNVLNDGFSVDLMLESESRG